LVALELCVARPIQLGHPVTAERGHDFIRRTPAARLVIPSREELFRTAHNQNVMHFRPRSVAHRPRLMKDRRYQRG
jgi:hypothetical protein